MHNDYINRCKEIKKRKKSSKLNDRNMEEFKGWNEREMCQIHNHISDVELFCWPNFS